MLAGGLHVSGARTDRRRLLCKVMEPYFDAGDDLP